jgi:hypothetical protein
MKSRIIKLEGGCCMHEKDEKCIYNFIRKPWKKENQRNKITMTVGETGYKDVD